MEPLNVVFSHDGSVESKDIKIAEDATVQMLLEVVEAEGMVIGELDAEILLLLNEEAKLVRREHRLADHGIRQGHRIHIAKAQHIFVAVVTTSGSWPSQGFESVPERQPVKHQLQRAANKLGLTDTSTWVAKVNGKEIDINKNYAENGLHCKVEIDYGPRAGGGGNE